jgi:hypothetical protein
VTVFSSSHNSSIHISGRKDASEEAQGVSEADCYGAQHFRYLTGVVNENVASILVTRDETGTVYKHAHTRRHGM